MSFLYIISHPKGWVKIGRAEQPEKRLRQHQQFSGEPLTGVWVFPCDTAKIAERHALRLLAEHRIMGEWFAVDIDAARDTLATITGNAAQPFAPPNQRPAKVIDDREPTSHFVQVRCARHLLGWSQTDLANAANASRATIMRFEEGTILTKRLHLAIEDALTGAGVAFIPDDGNQGMGVRLSVSASLCEPATQAA